MNRERRRVEAGISWVFWRELEMTNCAGNIDNI